VRRAFCGVWLVMLTTALAAGSGLGAGGAPGVRVRLRRGETVQGREEVLGRLVLESTEAVVVRTLTGDTLTIPRRWIRSLDRRVSLAAPASGPTHVAPWLYQLPLSQPSADELNAAFGPAFRLKTTDHYVFCYNTTDRRVGTTGQRLEKVYREFFTYFHQKGLPLHAPREKLPCVLFARRQQYQAHARRTATVLEFTSGFYHRLDNRVAFYVHANDPEYVQLRRTLEQTGARLASLKRSLARLGPRSDRVTVTYTDGTRRVLSRAQALRELADEQRHVRQLKRRVYLAQANEHIAVLAHEATHQLAASSGLLDPRADNPLWLDEGLAMFFESATRAHWAGIGRLNKSRWAQLIETIRHRRQVPIADLIVRRRFLDLGKEGAMAVYAQSWALTYFLMHRHQKAFLGYLARLHTCPPGRRVPDDRKLAMFKAAFGPDLDVLEQQWYEYVLALRP